jgi:hypothetical protein
VSGGQLTVTVIPYGETSERNLFDNQNAQNTINSFCFDKVLLFNLKSGFKRNVGSGESFTLQ